MDRWTDRQTDRQMIGRSIDRWVNCSIDRQAGLWKGRSTPKASVRMSQERKSLKVNLTRCQSREMLFGKRCISPSDSHSHKFWENSKRRSTIPSQEATEDMKKKVTRKEEAENNASKTQNPGNYMAASSASPRMLSLLSCSCQWIACALEDDFILMHT